MEICRKGFKSAWALCQEEVMKVVYSSFVCTLSIMRWFSGRRPRSKIPLGPHLEKGEDNSLPVRNPIESPPCPSGTKSPSGRMKICPRPLNTVEVKVAFLSYLRNQFASDTFHLPIDAVSLASPAFSCLTGNRLIGV